MSNTSNSSLSVAAYSPWRRKARMWSRWTLSPSQMAPGRTRSTACRALRQNATGTVLATSQRKPSTYWAQ